MHYIRFLKLPKYTSTSQNIHAVITVTTDLGDTFYPYALKLSCLIHVGPDRKTLHTVPLVAHQVQWQAGMRTLAVSMPTPRNFSKNLAASIVVQPAESTRQVCRHLSGVQTMPIIIPVRSNVLGMSASVADNDDREVVRDFDLSPDVRVSIWEDAGESIARHVWDAGVSMMYAIHNLHIKQPTDEHPPNKSEFHRLILHLQNQFGHSRTTPKSAKSQLNVLELGAGTGIVGITMALLFQNINVTLTDISAADKIIKRNIAANASYFQRNSTVRFTELDWDTAPQLPVALDSVAFDVIIAADCIYNADTSPALVRTMTALLAHGRVKREPLKLESPLVFVGQKRRHQSEGVFFQLMQDARFLEVERTRVLLPETFDENETDMAFAEMHTFKLAPQH